MSLKARSIIKKIILFGVLISYLFTHQTHAQLGFCSGNSGDSIFTETFGSGSGFNPLPAGTTTYNYINGFPNDGFYTVSNGSVSSGFDWHQIQDHTVGDSNGKMLIVNAAATAGEFYQTEISGLCPNTTYEFSAWVINLGLTNTFCGAGIIPINVRFEIRNSSDTATLASGNTGNIGATSVGNPSWDEYGLVFTTGTETSVILKMLNNGAGGCGNDLAIDDIEFNSCGDFVTIPDTSNNDSVTLCSTQAPFSTTLTANPDFSVYSNHFYQWEESIDGVIWNDIIGETNQSLSISTSITKFYRTKIAEVAANLGNSQCVSFSNEYRVTVNQLPSMPIINCWETATINNTTCTWDITGTQATQPTLVNCWDNFVFNNTTCTWENTGSQDVEPAIVNCWDNFVFNTTSCIWENTDSQDVEPAIVNCWDNFVFNTTSCTWENTGSQDTEPATVNCWDNFVFNTTSCTWENSGTQPGEIFETNFDLCVGDTILLQSNTEILNPNYIWNTGDVIDNITIDTPGIYTVEISGGVCSFETRIFNVTQIEIPIIETVISDGSDIIITTTNTGDFLYSLDGSVFQSNNIFSNIEGDFYTVFVKTNNCADTVSIQHLHFFIPAFFTPNNDGINDTFNLAGIEFYNSSEVFIYDRYGKLLKYTRNDSLSWDGTFKNQNLPTNDYWYVVIIEGQEFTGHVALKR